MQKIATDLPDVFLLEPDVYPDERGSFFENYSREKLESFGIGDDFLQDNVSTNVANVLRGLHFQSGQYAQTKLVSVISGRVIDVAVDIRKDSPTYGQWVRAELSQTNHRLLYIPKGFAHGFYTLEPSIFFYKVADAYYKQDAATGILWKDSTLAIDWGIPNGKQPIVSSQDSVLPAFTP